MKYSVLLYRTLYLNVFELLLKMWRFVIILVSYVLTVFTHVLQSPGNSFHHGAQYTVRNVRESMKHPYIEVRNATYHGNGPREEARAMCSVKTQEVNATANATITRRLHGVVTSRELHTAIQRLEVIIFGQMQQLWQSLDALRAQFAGDSRLSYPDRRSVSFRYKP